MSSETSEKVNSDLPDGEALSAFAPDAFAPPRRRRRDKDDTKPAAAEPVKEPEAPRTEPAAAAEEPSSPAAPAEPVTVPAPAASTETAPTEEQAKPAATIAVRTETAAPAYRTSPLPETVETGSVVIPDHGAAGARPIQCTIMVSADVRDRLARYQLRRKMDTGKEPTNAMVVRRAFLHARKNDLFGKLAHDLYLRQAPQDEEDLDDDGLLGSVAGRRTERGRMKDTVQQSFRPSIQELAAYDAFAEAYRFPSRSEFLDMVLDEFLTQLPTSGRRSR